MKTPILTAAVILALTLFSPLSCAKKAAEVKKDGKQKPPDTSAYDAARFELVKAFKSSHLKYPHGIILYLPKGYKDSTNRYPVLYAHDGQNLFNPKTGFGGNEWKLDENITALQQAGLLGDIIVVGIYNNSMRMFEYTPTMISDEGLVNQGGQLSNYGRFIVEELKPYIDSNYRTFPGREHTGVMGSSLGGIASFYLISWYPDVFGKAACISPSFWWDNELTTRDMASWKYRSDVKIYIDGGYREGADESSMVRHMRNVYRGLVAKGLKPLTNIFYYEDPAGEHNEFNWAKRGKYPLQFLFGKFSPEVIRVKPQVYPGQLGVGDVSTVFTEIEWKYGLRTTSIAQGYTLLPGGAAELINGNTDLLGLRAGTASLVYQGMNSAITQEIRVNPASRDMAVYEMQVISLEPADVLAFRVTNSDAPATNLILYAKMESPTNGVLTITNRVGRFIHITLEDGRGRRGLYKNGEPFEVLMHMKTKNMKGKLIITGWK